LQLSVFQDRAQFGHAVSEGVEDLSAVRDELRRQRLRPEGQPSARPEALSLKTRMTELSPVAQIPVQNARSVKLGPSANGPILAIAERGGAQIFSLRGAPAAVTALPLDGCRGVELTPAGPIAWGDQGIVSARPDGTLNRLAMRPVTAVHSSSEYLTVIHQDETLRLNSQTFAAEEPVQAFPEADESQARQPRETATPAAARSESGKGANDGGRTMNRRDHAYEDTPWFDQLAWIGRTAACADAEHVTVLKINRSLVA
jgi:hypothetical protein